MHWAQAVHASCFPWNRHALLSWALSYATFHNSLCLSLCWSSRFLVDRTCFWLHNYRNQDFRCYPGQYLFGLVLVAHFGWFPKRKLRCRKLDSRTGFCFYRNRLDLTYYFKQLQVYRFFSGWNFCSFSIFNFQIIYLTTVYFYLLPIRSNLVVSLHPPDYILVKYPEL